MTLKETVLYCIDTKQPLLCSNDKGEKYKYSMSKDALNYNFIQFGSKYFSNTISVDIDNTDVISVYTQIQDSVLPTPTMLVETPRGVHLHWVLENTISHQNDKAIFVRNRITSAIITLLDGDIHAVGIKRVFRNPLLYNVAFTDIKYIFKDFYKVVEIVESMQSSYKKERVLVKKCKAPTVNWDSVAVGNRHEVLFAAVSKYAYTKVNSKYKDLFSSVYYYARECNNKIPIPQTDAEIHALSKSIATWVKYKYTGSSDRTTNFNKKLAEKKAAKAKYNIKTSFLQAVNSMFSLADIRKLSGRRGAKLCGVAKATFLKYKEVLLQEIKDILLQAKQVFVLPIKTFSVFLKDIFYIINWRRDVKYVFSP